MLIQIQAIQIPKFWEVIKFAALNSANIKDEFILYYCIELLQDLLSGKKLCFIGEEDQQIQFVFILSLQQDKMKSYKYMYINNLYSFQKQNTDKWIIVLNDIIKISKKAGCKKVQWDTKNNRIIQLSKEMKSEFLGHLYCYNL